MMYKNQPEHEKQLSVTHQGRTNSLQAPVTPTRVAGVRQTALALLCGSSGWNPLRSCQAVFQRGATFPTSSHATDSRAATAALVSPQEEEARVEAETAVPSDERRGRNGHPF